MQFTKEQFIDVFVQYNNSVFPVQVILFLLAAAAVYLTAAKLKSKDKFISLILALLWLWIGVVYHYIFFTSINKAAYLFALLYIIQGILFLFAAFRGKLTFGIEKNIYSFLGVILIVYAFFIYPLLGYFFGHVYPASPTFGVPCPTTIFTFGILLLTCRHIPIYLLVIPVLWALIATSAVILFGIYEDFGLTVSAIISVAALFIKSRRQKVSQLSKA